MGFMCKGWDEGRKGRGVIYGDKTFTAKISKGYKVAEVTRMQGRPTRCGEGRTLISGRFLKQMSRK
jgi:hypothetical protein